MAAGANSGTPSKLSILPGTRVSCTTCTGEKVEGEVLAFDINQKIVVLKLPASSGAKGTCNINFINMDLLQDFSIGEECKKSPGPLPALDMNKIAQRMENNLNVRQRAAARIGVGVTPLGQSLFDTISKQYNNCHWQDTNICVQDVQVTVSEPYAPENCDGNPKAIDRIKKLVEKFHAEQKTSP